MNKPFYVVAESFKFARLYPLNQQDLPNQFKVPYYLLKQLENKWKHDSSIFERVLYLK